MTLMDPRPWSPASPHIGPDEEDLAMLEPTGDPEVDLGSAVLAAHRIGAAAAEAVARAPLPDEFRLVDALATARAAFASAAVDAVSKCVSSDNPRGYADLLLKDLFDAGESGALAVYRACVSKGVAPPLAVQRAGLVYGVPQDELGRYLAIAADPKSHPVALADAADRTVTHWAAGVVRAESSEAVSKAAPVRETVDQYNHTPFGQEHPKGSRGRFVDALERPTMVATPATRDQVAGQPAGFLARLRRDTGIGGQAAPDVDGAQVIVAEQPVVVQAPTAVRQPRVQRRQRTQRRQQVTGQQQAAPQAKVRLKTSLRSKLRGDFGPRLKARLDAQRASTEGVESLKTVSYDDEEAVSREFTQKLGSRVLAWSMSLQQGNEVFRNAAGAGTPDRPKFVRMGQLQQMFSEPLPWDDQHHHQMRTIADDASGDDRPRFIHITSDELEAHGVPVAGTNEKEVEEGVKDYARIAGYYDELAHEPGGEFNPMLKASMGLAPSADPGTHDWYLVLNPEPVVYGHPEGAPLPAAAEMVIVDDSENTARMNLEGSPDYPYFELDPTQEWIIHEPRTLWKQTGEKTGYWVDRYTVTPVDDWHNPDVGKAATFTAQRERWRTEPRNSAGEWTSGGFLARVAPTKTAPVEVTPVVTRIQSPRAQRKQRTQRQVRTAPVATEAAARAEANVTVSAKLPARLLHAFHSGLTEEQHEVIDTTMPAWDDRKRYVVFSADDWDHLIRQTGYKGFRNEMVAHLPLDGASRSNFLSRMRDAVDGTDADSEVRLHVENEIMERHRDERREIRSMAFHIDDDDDHASKRWAEMGRRIRNMMAVDQGIQSVRIDPSRAAGHYRVMVNKRPVSDVVVVVLPDDFDPDKPLRLEFSGRARQSALNRNVDRHYDEALHVDAPVQMFRATQGTKAIWHARQDER